MGSLFSICGSSRRLKREITILLIGLDNSGKTCTANYLLGESTDYVVPTVGFSCIQLKHGKYKVIIYDLGGGTRIRAIWKNYYALVHGVMFVVDSTAVQRIEECKKEISKVLKDPRISGKPLLMLINKQDLENAIDETEFCNLLDLETLVNEQKCPTRVESTSATTQQAKKKDSGIDNGFHWLIGHISKNFKEIHERVDKETNEQKEREEKEKAERMERVRIVREEREKAAATEMSMVQSIEHQDDESDNDSDVIIGNPFRPLKEEIMKKEAKKNHKETLQIPSGAHVINVGSSEDILKSDNWIQAADCGSSSRVHFENERDFKSHSSADVDSDMGNGIIGLSQTSLKTSEEGKIDKGKKVNKKKKYFKNKITPGDFESSDSPIQSLKSSRVRELPPLRHIGSQETRLSNSDLVPLHHSSSVHNGKINWALAEELIPYEQMKDSDEQYEKNGYH